MPFGCGGGRLPTEIADGRGGVRDAQESVYGAVQLAFELAGVDFHLWSGARSAQHGGCEQYGSQYGHEPQRRSQLDHAISSKCPRDNTIASGLARTVPV